MKIVCTILLGLAVILHSIELSSQSQRPTEPDDFTQSRPSTVEKTFPGVLGYSLQELELIRLRPYDRLNQIFELRKYTFPPDKPIGLKMRQVHLNPMPTGEQIVLSTSNGDAYAILAKSRKRTTILRAICTLVLGRPERARINMNSGAVEVLTDEEIAGCPVTVKDAIANSYEISRLSSQSDDFPDSDSHPSVHRRGSSSSPARSPSRAESPLRERSRSPLLRQTFSTIFGYKFDDLEFIRLSPKKFPHRKFKLRRYTFPQDKPIGMITLHRVLQPIPTGDQIVLSKSNGDVCAIIEKSQWRHTTVRPIFTSISGVLERVKINMRSGVFEVMTPAEMAECPGCNTGQVRNKYNVER